MLYFSDRQRLLCESSDGVNFTVINGSWDFKLHDDGVYRIADFKETPLIDLADLVKTTRAEFDKAHPNFGY